MLGCLWERMPSDATKNLVDALGCLPPFPLCDTIQWLGKSNACLTDSTNSYNQIAGVTQWTERACRQQNNSQDLRVPYARTARRRRNGTLIFLLPLGVAKGRGSFHATLRKQFASESYTSPILVQGLMLSENKEGAMAGSGMPLNVSREVGLRQVAKYHKVDETIIAPNASTT